jgi:hypothetical protein
MPALTAAAKADAKRLAELCEHVWRPPPIARGACSGRGEVVRGEEQAAHTPDELLSRRVPAGQGSAHRARRGGDRVELRPQRVCRAAGGAAAHQAAAPPLQRGHEARRSALRLRTRGGRRRPSAHGGARLRGERASQVHLSAPIACAIARVGRRAGLARLHPRQSHAVLDQSGSSLRRGTGASGTIGTSWGRIAAVRADVYEERVRGAHLLEGHTTSRSNACATRWGGERFMAYERRRVAPTL